MNNNNEMIFSQWARMGSVGIASGDTTPQYFGSRVNKRVIKTAHSMTTVAQPAKLMKKRKRRNDWDLFNVVTLCVSD